MKGIIELHLTCDCGNDFVHYLDNKNANEDVFFVCPRCSKIGQFIFWWAATTTGKIEDYVPQVVVAKERLEVLKNFKLQHSHRLGDSLIGP